MVEQLPCEWQVPGSNPGVSSFFSFIFHLITLSNLTNLLTSLIRDTPPLTCLKKDTRSPYKSYQGYALLLQVLQGLSPPFTGLTKDTLSPYKSSKGIPHPLTSLQRVYPIPLQVFKGYTSSPCKSYQGYHPLTSLIGDTPSPYKFCENSKCGVRVIYHLP